MATRTIPAGEFKAKCLKLMDEISESGQELVITKHGRPIARLVAVDERPHRPRMEGTVLWYHDPSEPAVDPDDWKVLRDE